MALNTMQDMTTATKYLITVLGTVLFQLYGNIVGVISLCN